MRLDRRTLARLILLLCVALVVTRVAGNHLHLCFDGSEPPVSFHTMDVESHHADEDLGHNDQDVDLPSATLAKIASFLLDFALLGAVFLSLVQLLTPQRVRPELLERDPEHSILHFLRPPLRGPPAFLPH